MSRHESFINRAVGVALSSECRWRHGAIIAHGSRLAAYAPNTHRNDPNVTDKDYSWHAEDAVLRAYARRKSEPYYKQDSAVGASIYVARVNTKNEPSFSRPCEECMGMLVYSGIKDIYYTNELGLLSHEKIM